MNALIAYLAAVACAQLGVPQLAGSVASIAMQLAALIPPAKLEALLVTLSKEAAHWLATRPPSEWGPPDFGGNIPAPAGPVPERPDPGAPEGPQP